ncbi:hypothetical protein Tco_0653795, partial [Tanacetum coccineum]
MEYLKTKMEVEIPYELLKNDQNTKHGINNKAKMTLYNALPHKEYERVLMCKSAKEFWHALIITHKGNSQVKDCNIYLLIQQYENFSISREETIDSGFTRFNAIVESQANDLATLSLDELIGNLKVYKMILENDGKGKGQVITLKAKDTRDSFEREIDSDAKIDSDAEIDSVTRVINLEEAAVMVSGIKMVEAQDKSTSAIITGKKFTSLVSVQSPRKTRLLSEELGAMAKTKNKPQKDATCLMAIESQEVFLKCDLLPDDLIVDSGCTKHMTRNRRLYTSYKAYDGGHVVFGSNLKGKVIGGGYSQTSKAYIVLNKEPMRIKESLNVTFDKSLPEPQSCSLVEDERINEPIVQDFNGSLSV